MRTHSTLAFLALANIIPISLFVTFDLFTWNNEIAGGILVALSIIINAPLFWAGRRLQRGLVKVHQSLEAIQQQRDLSLRLPHSGITELLPIEDSFNALLDQICLSNSATNKNIESLFESGAQISLAASEVTQASDQQLASTNSVLESMINLSNGISQVAANAQNISEQTANAHNLCKTGENSVRDVLNEIQEIEVSFQDINQTINSLSEHSNEIEKVIDVINDIAEQTNLLALNAAIEAARAGEQGRGFAVVADEVRTLAQRTREATVNVISMVSSIRKETDQAVNHMENNRDKVSQCVNKASHTADVLNQTIHNANEVVAHTDETASVINQQNLVSSEIEEMVRSIAELSMQSNSSIHTSNKSIYGLLSLAAGLSTSARKYSSTGRSIPNDIMERISRVRMNAVLSTNVLDKKDVPPLASEIAQLDQEIESLWQSYLSSDDFSNKQNEANEFWDRWQQFKQARAITLSCASNGDVNGARENAAMNAGPKFKQSKQALQALISY